MADLTTYKSKSIQSLMEDLDAVKYNPTGIKRTIFNLLDEITSGEVDIVDPSNPFVFLLGSSCVNAALAVNETYIHARSTYPSLSQTEEEVYRHMSDKDYIDRFAIPSRTEFTMVILLSDLLNKLVFDDLENCHKGIIPRNTEFNVDGYVFSIQYPIVIRKFLNGTIQISYDNSITSDLETLSTNIIDYTVRKNTDSTIWLFFNLSVSQFNIITSYYPLQQATFFSQSIVFDDQFYYCKVYYQNENTNNKWIPMLVTHSDQVYDPFKPTAVLKVVGNILDVFIPTIYLSSGLISGSIRIDVFNTKGEINVDLSSYKVSNFNTVLKAIDEINDLNDYTNVFADLSYYSYCDKYVNGGTNGIGFNVLRERVVDNSVGDRKIPITNVQLTSDIDNNGFDLVKNVDVITNRIFLATQKLPKPINTKLLTAANIGISSLIIKLDYLRSLSKARDNGLRFTLLSNNLFLNNNGVIQLLNDNDENMLMSLSKTNLVNQINSNQYLYNPFYYVLDNTSSEFELRAYHLDNPIANNLNFISQNQSLQLPVNTGSYKLSKLTNGYRLTVITKSGNFYKELSDGLVSAQLGYYPDGEVSLAYINGILSGNTTDGERIYTFDIETNYDIDNNDRLCIKNGMMFNTEQLDTWVNLSHKFYIFYATSSLTTDFVPDDADNLLGKFLLPEGTSAVTEESLDFNIGSALKNLWTKSRSFATGIDYQRYPDDVPMYYTEDVYEIDPVTGSIFSSDGAGGLTYTVLHYKNDPVLDELNNQVYLHRKGDVVLDNYGNPIPVSSLSVDKLVDLLFVDGKYYFTTDEKFISYRKEITDVLNTWIVNNIVSLQKTLLDKTKLFFFPKTTIGRVNVYPDSVNSVSINSEQSLVVDLYVSNSVHQDSSIREQLKTNTIQLLDNYIDNSIVNLTDISHALKALYGDTVTSLKISGLGDDMNYNIVTLASEHNRLCLKKQLVLQQDTNLIISEDVTVNFHNIEKTIV